MTMSNTVSGCYLHAGQDLQFDPVRFRRQQRTRSKSDHNARLCSGTSLLGHESAGEIIALGSDIHKTKPELMVGDSVAIECGIPCERCTLCKNDRYNVCPHLRFRSSASKFPHYQGVLQERINHPARWVHKLPKTIRSEVGALLEPLAVAVHAVRRAGVLMKGTRNSCLILGAGAIGLLCSLAAQVEGYEDIIMVDIDTDRLQFALENEFAQATYQVTTRAGASLEDSKTIAKEIARSIGEQKWQDGQVVGQVQRTFECTGVESCLQTSIYATQSGGSIILVGMGTPDHTLPISEISAREISIIPTWRYAGEYARAIEIAEASITGAMVNGKQLPRVDVLITHYFEGLDSIRHAFDYASKGKDPHGALIIKVAVTMHTTGRG